MPVTSFVGTVRPEGASWFIDGRCEFPWGDEHLSLALHDSVFNVVVRSPDCPTDDDWFDELWRRTSAGVRAALDTLGFYRGASLEIELLSATVDYESARFPGAFRPMPGTVDSATSEQMAQFLSLAIANRQFRRALADMRQAQRFDDDCAFYAYRVVENLRQTFSLPGDKDRSASWERLRVGLGFRKDEINDLTEAATALRHGDDGPPVDYAKKLEFVNFARGLVARFAEARTPGRAKVGGL